jgi:hypothetical protein
MIANMIWINIRKSNYLIATIYILSFILFFNKYTFSLLDPNPPLSKTVVDGLYILHIFNFIVLSTLFWKRSLFFQLLIGIATVIFFDLVLGLFISRDGHKEFRIKQPEPYAEAKYFSEDFIIESFTQPGGYILGNEYGSVKPKNFKGIWFNVENNQRVTKNKSNVYKNKIYLFGGSTVYGSEVPDEFTIASQLAFLGANSAFFEVVNMGVSSIHSSQQFALLKGEVKLNKDDIVVFYDGINDVLQRIIYDNKKGFMYGDGSDENIFLRLLRLSARFSSISLLLTQIMTKNIVEIPDSLIDNSIKDYMNVLKEANLYVTRAEAKFYHFLQPTLFTKKNLNKYEYALIRTRDHLVPNQIKKTFEIVYPIIEKKLNTISFSDSLTDAFDHFHSSPYLDFVHVSHTGNKEIAKRMWKLIHLKN